MSKFVTLLFLCLCSYLPAQIMLTADLDGSKEVPAVTTTGKGTAWAVILPDNKTVTYRITYARLSGTFSASHFHLGAEGSNGGVLQGITFTGNTAQATWVNVPDSVIAKMVRGQVYINVHSSAFPNGEIRGQLQAVNGAGFGIALTGSQEVPAVTTNASGTGYAYYDAAANNLVYRATIAGLSGSLTASHFHNAATGANGGVLQNITITDSTTTGTWSSLTPTHLGELFRRRVYMNVHSSVNTGGEIRGQLVRLNTVKVYALIDGSQEVPAVTTPAKGTLWGVMNETGDSVALAITYNRLSSAYSASHIHVGMQGTTGPVAFNLPTPTGEVFGYISGLSDTARAYLLQGMLYFNVHSSTNPNGEIRGQIKQAPQFFLTGRMTGAQEVPANSSGGKGTAIAWMNATGGLEYQFTFKGLTAAPSAAHFHKGAFGATGGVVNGFTITDSTITGTWAGLTDANILDLLSNNIYANIHTANFTGGEIRGQMWYSNVYYLPVPVELTSFSASVTGGKVMLNWATGSEKNNRGFEIQRSTDNRNFVTVGFVQGNGTVTERKEYSFNDNNAPRARLYYRLRQVDYDGSASFSSVAQADNSAPGEFALEQNYPNPFNPSTVIAFSLPERSFAELTVYNVLGQAVARPVSGILEAGKHTFNFNAENLPAGVYIYKLSARNNAFIRKMTLLK